MAHLLRASGNDVYPYGLESTMLPLVQPESRFKRAGEVADKVRLTPDFVVMDLEGKIGYAEVKFRTDGSKRTLEREAAKIQQHWPTHIIRVRRDRKPYFEIGLPPHARDGEELSWLPLADFTAWQIDPTILSECETLVEKYFPQAD